MTRARGGRWKAGGARAELAIGSRQQNLDVLRDTASGK